MMQHNWLFLFLVQRSFAWPTLLATREDDKFEWTALGDSYASGVGSTDYVDGRRCLRYDRAYPVLLNDDKTLAGGDHIFNNVACSGAHYDDVEKYQFYDEDTYDQPNFQYNKIECHGIHGDIWVMHRDKAVKNANDFCAQGSKSVEYNQGSVNHLRLSVDYPADGSKGPGDSPDCVGRFVNGVIDGCDGNDPINNPHNYKFGSTLTLGNGWVFKMEALSRQINEASCDVSYRFVFDGFEVRGKNWPDAKLGPNGEGLLDELKGCGAVTKWNFEWTPNDVKFHWYARGQLPIGTKSCVGKAVQSAGGSSKGNCHGPGKMV